jgi:type IV pilus assembly protein PilV
MKPRLRRAQRGVTMVESLVALVVLSVGMLGIAGLYITSLKAGRSALVRTQAVALATDLADRIRANRLGLGAYATAGYGTDGPAIQTACLGGDCAPDKLAQDDLGRWLASIKLLMPGDTKGAVTFTDNAAPTPDRYTLTISWRESGDTADSTCTMVVDL